MKTSLSSVASLALSIAFWCSGCALAQGTSETSKAPDVIFVPTPQQMVDVMLKMADVKPGEMVYDLGCGDGRIVVTAARDFGARGIGVDIDPKRIKESQDNVREAKVGDRVQIKQADLFQMDFSDADVVALYLLPALNLRLRPRILDELRPGTRIVSNSFDMGDWRPDQQAEDSETGQSMYFWVVPAKVQGMWNVALPDGKKGSLLLMQEFQSVTGTLRVDGTTVPLRDPTLRGATLIFNYGEPNRLVHARAEVNGDKINGMVRQGESGQPQPWSGHRSMD